MLYHVSNNYTFDVWISTDQKCVYEKPTHEFPLFWHKIKISDVDLQCGSDHIIW